MKSFRFGLEAVRTLRQRSEQEALERYAATLLRRRQAWSELDAAERAHASACADWRRRMEAGSTAGDMVRSHGAIAGLQRLRVQAVERLSVAERELNQARQLAREARQRRELVDKVRERAKHAFDRERLQMEFRELDDLSGRRASARLVDVSS